MGGVDSAWCGCSIETRVCDLAAKEGFHKFLGPRVELGRHVHLGWLLPAVAHVARLVKWVAHLERWLGILDLIVCHWEFSWLDHFLFETRLVGFDLLVNLRV